MPFETLDSIDSVYCACSAEFYDNAVLAIGTYQIAADETVPVNAESPATKRLGRCLVYDTSHATLTETFRLDMSAILDMKWHKETLAIANAQGRVTLHRLALGELHDQATIVCAPTDILALSLCWSASSREIVTSLSDGSCCIASGEDFQTLEHWPAHDYEAWIAAFDRFNDSLVYSGGDDCKLKVWDRRQGFQSPVTTNKRFEGGVTSIQHHPSDEHLVAVGSYDARLRLFDKRNMLLPVLDEDVGGGIWRIKWHPTQRHRLALATMHDGFKVLDLSEADAGWTQAALEPYRKHESLAYGVDWNRSGTRLASCSFYDHMIALWTPA